MKTLIIGCGYVGMELGKKLALEGHQVYALRKSSGAWQAGLDIPLIPIAANIIHKESLSKIKPEFDWVVFSASAGNQSYQELYYHGTQNVLEWLRKHPPQKYVYTSSTGVYSQNDGSLVMENSPCHPLTSNNQILKETEDILIRANMEYGFPGIILRVAGIYGPNRGYWLNKFRAGEAISGIEAARYVNMVHLEDVAGAVMRSLTHGPIGEIFNVVDSEPATPSTIFQWLSTFLKQPIIQVPNEPVATRRNSQNKRVSNKKLREFLGYQLIYPTFREGFAHEIKHFC